jgi:REP element-mobilizing transposase RayT
VYHAFGRGNRRAVIFEDDVDRAAYLGLLGKSVRWYGWRCLMYCLMDNHVHLLIETPRPNLDVGMQMLHGSYARHFNRRHAHSGHVFQGRYGAERSKDDGQLITAATYIAANPVAAGLARDPADWEWSSHAAAMAGTAPVWLDTPRLVAYFGAAGGDPWRRYARAVAQRCLAVSPAACAPNRSPSSPGRRASS